MAQLLAGLAALFSLINEIWSSYQEAKLKEQGRKEAEAKQAAANAKAKANAELVRKNTAGLRDGDLDRELSNYYRD